MCRSVRGGILVCRDRYLLGHDPATRARVAHDNGFGRALATLRAIVAGTEPHLESTAVVTT
jgi:hypothetical protein